MEVKEDKKDAHCKRNNTEEIRNIYIVKLNNDKLLRKNDEK